MKGDYLNDFLNDYRDRCDEKNEEPIPKAKLRAVLEDFVLTELWHEEDPTLLDVAFSSLRRIAAKDKAASQILKIIENETEALGRKLERQRAANAILQEQVVMLADQVRQ